MSDDAKRVVRTGNFTARDHRLQRGVMYERGTDEPSPTLTANGQRWLLHTNRDQREDGARQVVEGGRPAPSLTAKSGGQWVLRPSQTVGGRNVGGWGWERPAMTVCGDPRFGEPGHRDREGGEPQFRNDGVRITEREALILQSFPPDYPVQGSRSKRFEQIGNAVPPRLAMHVLASLLGVELQEDDVA